MNCIARVAASIGMSVWLAGLFQPAFAQGSSTVPQRNDLKGKIGQIDWEYKEPAPGRKLLVAEMQKARMLEDLSKFLSALNLPYGIHVTAEECVGMDSPHYNPAKRAIAICYQFDELLNEAAPAEGERSKEGLTRLEVIKGTLWGVVLHELGHALFDMLEVPVFGREEDAADQLAMFLALETAGNNEQTRMIIGGFAHFWRSIALTERRAEHWKQWTAYTDLHGSDLQRYRNTVCLAYGRDRETFGKFTAEARLTDKELDNCTKDYQQVSKAFWKTILPFFNTGQKVSPRASPLDPY